MRTTQLACLLALLLTGVAAQAQIYKSVDEQGNVTYSDTPPEGQSSEEVELNQTNTTPPTVVTRPAPVANKTNKPAAAETPSVTINSPANETTIPMGGGIFDVSASASPALKSGQALQLQIDGAPWGDPQPSGNWHLENVFRGQHDLTVQLLDSDGNVLGTSDPVRVYVMRPSLKN